MKNMRMFNNKPTGPHEVDFPKGGGGGELITKRISKRGPYLRGGGREVEFLR